MLIIPKVERFEWAQYAVFEYRLGMLCHSPIVTGHGFTGDQRFLIAYARVWAENMREQVMRRALATDPHPLDKFRVNLSLQNLPEFQNAFGCVEGDAMVRAVGALCRLW